MSNDVTDSQKIYKIIQELVDIRINCMVELPQVEDLERDLADAISELAQIRTKIQVYEMLQDQLGKLPF